MRKLAQPLTAQDKEQLRIAFASGIGLRELARRTGRNENTLLGIANREGWTKSIEAAKTLAAPTAATAPAVPQTDVATAVVQSGEDLLKANSSLIKRRLSNGLAKGAAAVELMEGGKVVESSQNIAQLARAAGQVHGWDDDGDNSRGGVNIAITIRREDMKVVQVSEPVIDV